MGLSLPPLEFLTLTVRGRKKNNGEHKLWNLPSVEKMLKSSVVLSGLLCVAWGICCISREINGLGKSHEYSSSCRLSDVVVFFLNVEVN